jgi:hypothetical protein
MRRHASDELANHGIGLVEWREDDRFGIAAEW